MTRGFDMIAAVDRDLGIARDGELPWHLPVDLAYFKNTTTQTTRAADGADMVTPVNAVIMGRKTWESIPPRFRPLSGRRNVVLTRATLAVPKGVLVAASLGQALALVDAEGTAIDRIFVVGGGELYAQAIATPACRRLYITRVLARFGCDTFFPEFESAYELEEVVAEGEENGLAYRIEVWRNPRPMAGGDEDQAGDIRRDHPDINEYDQSTR